MRNTLFVFNSYGEVHTFSRTISEKIIMCNSEFKNDFLLKRIRYEKVHTFYVYSKKQLVTKTMDYYGFKI